MIYYICTYQFLGTAKPLDEIKAGFMAELQMPNTEQQSGAELKDIKKIIGESAWEYDQRFRDLISRLSYPINEIQHKEGFIQGLLPLTRMPLMRRKWTTQQEALAQAIYIEAINGYQGAAIRACAATIPLTSATPELVQFQSQLSALAKQIQKMNRTKMDKEEVWCKV